MKVKRFIIIDDDPINNKLCRYLIGKVASPDTEILDFTSADGALSFISDTYISSACTTVVFLDINMPDINGWEFLTNYELLPKSIQQQIDIYILSSSVDGRDKDRAYKSSYISDFIVKPLRVETISSILDKLHSTNT
ncbi:MAG: response regulator [Bacteroidota bacterium]